MNALHETLDRLVGEGVLTPEQAEQVSAGTKTARSRRRVSPLVEVGGYLGGALAGVSAIAVLERFWEQLTSGGQVGLLVLAATALWAAGLWVVGDTEPAVRRLVGALWLLSTATATAAAGVAAAELADLSDERVALVTSLVAVVHAGWLWRVTRGALQQIALFVGVIALGVSGLAQFEAPPEEWFGLLVWALALAWALLVWGGLITPARTGYVLGGIGMIAGAEALHMTSQETFGVLLGLTTALALFAAAAALQQLVTAGLGIVATTIFLPQALIRWFGETIDAPLIVFFVGLVILAGALFAVRVAKADEEVASRA